MSSAPLFRDGSTARVLRWGPGAATSVDSRVIDGALVVGGLLLTVLAVKTPWSGLDRPLVAGAGIVGSLALWWRRDRPVEVAAVATAAAVLSGNPGPLLVALFTVAQRRSRWWQVSAVLVGTAALSASVVPGGDLTFNDALSAALMSVVAVVGGAYSSTRRDLVESLQRRAEQSEAERRLRDEQARAEERTRIAGEMHDVLAHKVSLIAIHAGALEVAGGEAPDRVASGAALIRSTAHEALEELRTVLGVLRSSSDARNAPVAGPDRRRDDDPFVDLDRLCDSWRASGADITLDDTAAPMPARLGRTVHRIVQEALTNAAKHAPGAPVRVTVTGAPGSVVTVRVANGPAASPPSGVPGSGTGLVGLAERSRLVGGAIEAGPLPDRGWCLTADLPWTAPTSPTGRAASHPDDPIGASA